MIKWFSSSTSFLHIKHFLSCRSNFGLKCLPFSITLMGLNFAGIKFRGWRLPRNSNISRGFNFADGLLSDFSRISRMGTPDFWWISRMGLQYFLNAKLGY